MDTTKMLTDQEAADMLRLPVATVLKLRRNGHLAYHRTNPVKISECAVIDYIESLENCHSVEQLTPARRDMPADPKRWTQNTALYSSIKISQK